jgi:hypothetical protein
MGARSAASTTLGANVIMAAIAPAIAIPIPRKRNITASWPRNIDFEQRADRYATVFSRPDCHAIVIVASGIQPDHRLFEIGWHK